jgi:hypothetical protein
MKPQTLTQAAKEVATQSARSNPRYHNLNRTQLEKLTAYAMRDVGKYAYEYISDSCFIEDIAGTLINALETQDTEQRKELLIKLGELLIDGAIDQAKKPINDALDNAATELAVARQFYQELDYDYSREIGEPMRKAIYNHPEL